MSRNSTTNHTLDQRRRRKSFKEWEILTSKRSSGSTMPSSNSFKTKQMMLNRLERMNLLLTWQIWETRHRFRQLRMQRSTRKRWWAGKYICDVTNLCRQNYKNAWQEQMAYRRVHEQTDKLFYWVDWKSERSVPHPHARLRVWVDDQSIKPHEEEHNIELLARVVQKQVTYVRSLLWSCKALKWVKSKIFSNKLFSFTSLSRHTHTTFEWVCWGDTFYFKSKRCKITLVLFLINTELPLSIFNLFLFQSK